MTSTIRSAMTENIWNVHTGTYNALALSESTLSYYCDPGVVANTSTAATFDLQSGLQLDNPFVYHDGSTQAPRSVCSDDCGRTQKAEVDMFQSEVACCWQCVACNSQNSHEYTLNMFASECTACLSTTVVNANQSGCDELPVQHWSLGSSLGILLVVTATIMFSFMTTLSVLVASSLFGQAHDLPLGREFSLYVFATIGLGSFSLLLFGVRPTTALCVVQHLTWACALVAPLLPTAVYAFYQLAVLSFLKRLEKLNSAVTAGREASFVNPLPATPEPAADDGESRCQSLSVPGNLIVPQGFRHAV